METPKCLDCQHELHTMGLTIYGVLLWDGDKWVSESYQPAVEYICSGCGTEFTAKELDRLRVPRNVKVSYAVEMGYDMV